MTPLDYLFIPVLSHLYISLLIFRDDLSFYSFFHVHCLWTCHWAPLKESVLPPPSLQFYINEICPEPVLLQAQQSQLSASPQNHGAQEELRETEQVSDDQCEHKLEWS